MFPKQMSASALFIAAIAVALIGPHAPSNAQEKKKEQDGPKHVFAGPAPVHDFDLILARPTDKSITASAIAYKPLVGYISYGKDKGQHSSKTKTHAMTAVMPVEILLSDLNPDTTYYYQFHLREPMAAGFTPQPESSFRTQRKPGSSFTFTIQSDSHLDQSTRADVYERTLANALMDRPDFHVDLGDTFMTDKYENYKDALPQYIAQRYYFSRIAHAAPLFLVLGNHDGESLDSYNGSPDCMSVWSSLNRKKYFPNPSPDGFYSGNKTELKHVGRLENYYAWEWGDALFVVLDPFWTTSKRRPDKTQGNWSRTLGAEQYQWLAKTLADSKVSFKFVFIHHLVGGLDSSARGGSEAAGLYEWGGKDLAGKDVFKTHRPEWEMPIHQLLVKHKVSVVFHGHDHFFARQDLDGVAYVLVPQPGHSGVDRLRNLDKYGYVRGDFLPPSGHIRVSVTAGEAVVEYVRAYLPESEDDKRENREVGNAFRIKS